MNNYKKKQMNKRNNLLLLYLFFLPFVIYAHGEDLLILIWSELFLIIAFIIILLNLKISLKGKGLLIMIFILTEFAIYSITSDLPYMENRLLINLGSIGIPILIVLISYLFIKKRMRKTIEKSD